MIRDQLLQFYFILIIYNDSQSEAMSSVCENVKTNVLTPEEKEVILKRHNELRVEHAKNAARGGLIGPVKYNEFRPITWSDELAEIAQRWANQCVDGHDKCRRTSCKLLLIT